MNTVIEVQLLDEAVSFFILRLYLWEAYESNYSLSSYGQIVWQTVLINLGMAAGLEEVTLWIQTS